MQQFSKQWQCTVTMQQFSKQWQCTVTHLQGMAWGCTAGRPIQCNRNNCCYKTTDFVLLQKTNWQWCLKINITVLQVTAVFTCSWDGMHTRFQPTPVHPTVNWTQLIHNAHYILAHSQQQLRGMCTKHIWNIFYMVWHHWPQHISLSYRKPASAWTSSYSCHDQVRDTRNIL
jgi:hypothetical protein